MFQVNYTLKKSSQQPNEVDRIPSFPMKKWTLGKIKQVAQGHTANEWQNQDINMNLLVSKPLLLTSSVCGMCVYFI